MRELFSQDWVEGSFRAGMITVHPRSEVQFTFSSERIPIYAVHFIGRAFICPDSLGLDRKPSCPACGTISRRVLGWAVSGTERYVQVIELGQPTLEAFDRARKECSVQSLTGTRWNFSRSVAKRPLWPKFIGIDPTASRSPISDQVIMKAFCRLHGLESPSADLIWDQFANRIVEQCHRKLARQLVG